VAQALEQAVHQRGYGKVGHVGVPELPCDEPAPTAGFSRFPVKAWQKDRIEALVFHGDAHCAREAIAEVKAARFQVPLVLGLEAAQIVQDFGDPATLAVAAGAYPAGLRAGEPKDMAEWLGHTGQAPSWYTVLGHDAGLLAAEALGALPLEGAEDADAVQSLHARARDRLATATAGLWSTERRGFEGGRVLRRELSVVAAGSRAR
jgi:hypothetical protein